MYDVGQFQRVALRGLSSMGRALVRRSTHPLGRRFTVSAWGPWPWMGVLVAASLAAYGGLWIEAHWLGHRLADRIYWPLVLFAVFAAWRVRAVVNGSVRRVSEEGGGVEGRRERAAEGFEGLALPLIYGGVLTLLLALGVLPALEWLGWRLPGLEGLADEAFLHWPESTPERLAWLAQGVEYSLGMAAAMAITVVSLSFRKGWLEAAIDLLVRLFVFGILLNVTLLVLGYIQPFSRLAGFLSAKLLSVELTDLVRMVLDSLGNHGVISILYLGIIGGLWLAAQSSFPRLLEEGDVDLLVTLDRLMDGAEDWEKPPKPQVPEALELSVDGEVQRMMAEIDREL